MKYAINSCYGGFGLSQKALEYLRDVKGWKVADHVDSSKLYHSDCLKLIEEGYSFYLTEEKFGLGPLSLLHSNSDLSFRSNPDVIEAIEKLGEEANDRFSSIEIVEANCAPELLEIDEYDGMETLQTVPTRFN